MRSIHFPDGTIVPSLGQGTWQMGESPGRHAEEVDALRRGLDLGMTVLDTAEMYGDGRSEALIAEAIAGRRDEVFLVSKAYPQNAGRTSLPRACEASLQRLNTDRLDLYLLHWRGSIALADTVEAMEKLVEAGKILRWGVSNFDVDDMEELFAAGGRNCAINQILYNITRRGPEYDLLPWLNERNIPVMAYSPIEQGRMLRNERLKKLAETHQASVAQLGLAFLLNQDGVMAIPKASTKTHVEENRKAADLRLSADDLAAINKAFPPPARKQALAML